MAEKKIPISASPGDEALEKRVAAMMGDTNTLSAENTSNDTSGTTAKIDVSKYQPSTAIVPKVPASAPELPLKVRKKIPIKDSSEVAEPPVKPVTVEEAVKYHETKVEREGVTPLDDEKTAAAIDEIAASDADVVLKTEDENRITKEAAAVTKKPKPHSRRKWVYGFFILLILAAGALLAVPSTRYKVLGLAIKRSVLVRVIDAETRQPVSAVTISVDGQQAVTGGNGTATVKASPGPQTFSATKQFYAAGTRSTEVPLTGEAATTVSLRATGRRVPITVVNSLTGKPISDAEIKVGNTSARTDRDGKTTVVLSTQAMKQAATISAKDYNNKNVTVEVTASVVPANTFSLVAAGKIYALSNENGTIDVIKTNLDGSGKATVVKGTGREDQATTVLLASRDWRYVVLKAQRDTPQASMYLLDTKTDKLTEFDSGDASFTPIGWYNHTFIYDVVRNTVSTAQSGHEVIKSFDADKGQLNQLDQTQVSDVNGGSYAYQTFYNFYILENRLIYNAQWFSSGGASLANKSNAIRGVQPNGQNKKDFVTLDAEGMAYIQAALVGPQEVYYAAYNTNDNKTTYLAFENGTAKISSDVDASDFNRNYPTYLISPSGNRVFWSEQRNGRQTPILGNKDANSERVLTDLNGYTAFGWFTDNYLLISQNNSELYIVSAADAKTPVKLTDYFKPDRGIPGYGYGYGGL